MTSAIAVPAVAAAVPRMIVFLSASVMADSSNSTKCTFCQVAVLKVTKVVATGEKAALSSAK